MIYTHNLSQFQARANQSLTTISKAQKSLEKAQEELESLTVVSPGTKEKKGGALSIILGGKKVVSSLTRKKSSIATPEKETKAREAVRHCEEDTEKVYQSTREDLMVLYEVCILLFFTLCTGSTCSRGRTHK